MRLGFIVLTVVLVACGSASRPETTPRRTVRLAFVGDVMLGRGVAATVAGDPGSVFEGVRHVLSAADFAFGNLESPLTGRPHSSANTEILSADPSAATVLSGAGFDVLGIANNHATDSGEMTVVGTLSALRDAGLAGVGGGDDATEAGAPLVLEAGEVRVAILAFDATGVANAAGEDTPGVNPWDEERAAEAVSRARARAEVVVVGVHGGAEYLEVPDADMRHIVELLAGWDVDVVWGHGAHLVQPVDVADPDGDGRSTVIAPSLGNFLFDQVRPGTEEGAVLEVLAGADGPVAYRLAGTSIESGRVSLDGWQLPAGDAALLGGGWWTPTVEPPLAGNDRAPVEGFPGGDVVFVAEGDVTGDGAAELVVSFRRPFQPTPYTRLRPEVQWADSSGRSAHVGVYRTATLEPVWVAGTLARPVERLAVCDGSLAVAYSSLDDPAVIATGGWMWNGFGFDEAPDLEGGGRIGCHDVDGDGALDPVVTGR